MNDEVVTIKNPYGGLIVFTGTGNITFTMDNVVEAPRYDVSDPGTASQWEQR